MKTNYLFNHEYKVFTCEQPKNTFIIDTSNGYPVQVTTNITKNTSWKDVLKGNYDYANPNGTPENLVVNGIKYTYIDYKYATKYLGYIFKKDNTVKISKYTSKTDKVIHDFFKKVL